MSADVNRHLHNYEHSYYLAPPQSLSRKQMKTNLKLCKPLFIVDGRVKRLFKIYATVQKQSTSVAKVDMAHA